MTKAKVLVTGGAGFLGQHLVQQLLDTGKYEVMIFDIRESATAKAPVIIGDLRKPDEVAAAVDGCQIVFHCATAPPDANALNNALMFSVNVEGTRNVIKACIDRSVPNLIFTSSASVVFEGRNLCRVDENQPYATKPLDHYTRTKIDAEKLVLAANGRNGLRTVALRPSAIFGEHDPLLVPTTVKQARAGKLKFYIGDGKNQIDWTYVGNVAQAHLHAADALTNSQRCAEVAGKAFFITNHDPKPFWGFLGDICQGLGYARPYIGLPFWLIIGVACVFEYVIRPLLSPIKTLNTDFTVSRLLIASCERTFNNTRAIELLGYRPKVPMDIALERTLASFEALRNPAHPIKKAS